MRESLHRRVGRSHYGLFTALLAVGFLLILVKQGLAHPNDMWKLVEGVVGELGTAVAVSACVYLLQVHLIDSENDRQLRQMLRLNGGIKDAGLTALDGDALHFNARYLLEDAATVSLVAACDKAWLERHSAELKRRFGNPTLTTHVFLVDSDEDDAVAHLAASTMVSPELCKQELRMCFALVRNLWRESSKNGVLNIHLLKIVPRHFLIATNSSVLLRCDSLVAPTQDAVMFEFNLKASKKTAFCHQLLEEIERLKQSLFSRTATYSSATHELR